MNGKYSIVKLFAMMVITIVALLVFGTSTVSAHTGDDTNSTTVVKTVKNEDSTSTKNDIIASDVNNSNEESSVPTYTSDAEKVLDKEGEDITDSNVEDSSLDNVGDKDGNEDNTPELPVIPVEPGVVPDEPKEEIPWTPLEPATPVVPDEPKEEIPWTPLEPATPVVPDEPKEEIPWTPLEPATPVVPDEPKEEIPWTPLEPATPVVPDEPKEEIPWTPLEPAIPVVPEEPKEEIPLIPIEPTTPVVVDETPKPEVVPEPTPEPEYVPQKEHKMEMLSWNADAIRETGSVNTGDTTNLTTYFIIFAISGYILFILKRKEYEK